MSEGAAFGMDRATVRGVLGLAVRGIARFGARLEGVLFPPCCAFCMEALEASAAAVPVCDRCRVRACEGFAPQCGRCGALVARANAGAKRRCAACRYQPAEVPPALACGPYAGAAGRLVRRLKYGGRTAAARVAGWWAAERLRHARATPGLLVCVPSDRARVRRRALDHTALVLAALARELGWPCAPEALVRRRAVAPLAHRARAERWAALAGAFAADPKHVAGRAVWIYDDVLSSGATLAACARALRAAGAKRVRAIVLARRRRWEEEAAKRSVEGRKVENVKMLLELRRPTGQRSDLARAW